MKFNLEQSEIDFGVTHIDNIFIEDFMPVANGSFVKVYLYAYKNMMSGNYEMDNERLAKNLSLTVKDVENAWDYWENEGVIEKKYNIDGSYDIEFKNLKLMYLVNMSSNNYKEKPKPEVLIDVMSSNKKVREMFNNIDYFMRRQTIPTEKIEILSWINNYNMSPEIVEMAFEYCTEKKQRISVNYVRAVVISWYDKGLSTEEAVEREIEKSDKKYARKNAVLRKLGLQFRVVSEPEINMINAWYDEYAFSEELIDEAINRTSKISRPSISYVNSILMRWRELDITTKEDIEKKDRKPEAKKVFTKNKFHNFKGKSENLSDEQLNDIAKNLTKRRNTNSEK